MKKMMKMNGTTDAEFYKLFDLQVLFQKMLAYDGSYGNVGLEDIPEDNIELSKYHCVALLEEIGELVKSDKRWKNYRNKKYDKENKLEELADCIITIFNIAMFSGFNGRQLSEAVFKKINENRERYVEEKAKKGE